MRALLAVVALVLLAHVMLLQALQGAGAAPAGPEQGADPMLARQIVVPVPVAAPAPLPAAPPAARAAQRPPNPAPASATEPRAEAEPPAERVGAPQQPPATESEPGASPAPVAPSTEAPAVVVDAAPAPATPASATPSSAPTADNSTPPAGAPPPVYRTQPAPAATMQFVLKRGLVSGQATLQWHPQTGPDGQRYLLTLQAQAFGIHVAGWNSSGRFDAAGLAPDRYVESRRGREVRATNFQRAAGKVSFSAQSLEFDLAEGTQDRSSWMLQLGAVLNANPAQAQPGAQTTMVVAGTRGAPEPWVFTVVERGPLTLGDAESPITVPDAVQLLREPRRPYDTRARIWLDPARHHLPLKVQMLVHATGEGQEFELRQLNMP